MSDKLISAIHTGIGFKPVYYDQLKTLPSSQRFGWLEIHAENYMGEGGPTHQILRDLKRDYSISCHGVGLSLGAEQDLDKQHLKRLDHLLQWLKPDLFSEHLAWSSHEGIFFNDLLPLPYTHATLCRICDHIDQTQDTLGRQLLLENPSVYVSFAEQDYLETDFLYHITQKTGCGLLLDVNNVFVSCTNNGQSAQDYIANFPMDVVGEIHLGGHSKDSVVQDLLIDNHGDCVADQVWTLYRDAIIRLNDAHKSALFNKTQLTLPPTIVEWDNDLPDWEILLDQTMTAKQYLHDNYQLNDKYATRFCQSVA